MKSINELVHNSDKTATYKLALLLALVDIAQKQRESVVADSDGNVQIPYSQLIDQWIIYYYPLLLQGKPQLPFGRKPAYMETLLRTGRKCGASIGEDILNKPNKGRALRMEIWEVLRKGPIVHTRDTSNLPLFQEYKVKDNRYWGGICIKADLWKELCAQSTAIREALLLEWDHLSLEFSETQPSST